ncbi:MAG TPA: EAL domain-containing protein, partial [Chiayiivirga sp.]|nr:EAL domain-containing protein [Chiayiivirga sp.]
GVKIDRSFVSGMLDDADDLALTAAIIAMAHSLGIVVTAEGVESQGQVDALEARGCDNLQGFLLGRPMSAADLVRELGG